MAMWEPWRGCHKISDGCSNCYIYKGDVKRGIDTSNIVKTSKFYLPIEKKSNGEYKIKKGSTVYTCFSSDFLLEEADLWRQECFKMIKERSDLFFIFLTKRIERFKIIIPADWGQGYDNVLVGCTVENQSMADERLRIFRDLPIKHKNIVCQPLLENINIEKYIESNMLVIVGGEYGNFDWIMNLRNQCIRKKSSFELRQLGTNFVKDGVVYKLRYRDLSSQAKKANLNINYNEGEIENEKA